MGRFIVAALAAVVLLLAVGASSAQGSKSGCHSKACHTRVWVKDHPQRPALASVYEDGGPCTAWGPRDCPTASGYTRYYGVAHKTLRFGTLVRICYRRCVTATVDDRGPYVGPREFDLNMNVMRATGFPYGVAVIRVRIWHRRLN